MVLNKLSLHFSVSVHLRDYNQLSSRSITKMKKSSGDMIRLNQPEDSDFFYNIYEVQFRKTIEEATLSKTCMVYPNEKYNSFQECDDEFIQNSFKYMKL